MVMLASSISCTQDVLPKEREQLHKTNAILPK
jgi:hypothetical protein